MTSNCVPFLKQKFKNFDEFSYAVSQYGDAAGLVFVVKDSRANKYRKFVCKHFGAPRSDATGVRPNQMSFKTWCPCFIYGKYIDDSVVISALNLKHENHEVKAQNLKFYPEKRRLTQTERDKVKDLVNMEVNPAMMQKEIRKLTGKVVDIQDICNIRYKAREESRGNLSKLEEAVGVLVDLLERDEDAVVILGIRDPSEEYDSTPPLKLFNLRTVIRGQKSNDAEVVEEVQNIVQMKHVEEKDLVQENHQGGEKMNEKRNSGQEKDQVEYNDHEEEKDCEEDKDHVADKDCRKENKHEEEKREEGADDGGQKDDVVEGRAIEEQQNDDVGDNDDIRQENRFNNSTLMFIFIQLGSMRDTFARNPEVVLMDDTYNITECRMPLNICMVVDGHGSGRVISYTFLGNEQTNTIIPVLQCLQTYNPQASKKIQTMVIDKDMSERVAISTVFPAVHVEICTFHALNALKESTKRIESGKRESVRQLLQEIVYSTSEEEYSKKVKDLETMSPPWFYEKFLTNWDSMKEAWVFYEKLFVPNFGNNTTNRVESKNKHLKDVVDKDCTLAETIRGLLLSHENKENSVAIREFRATSTVSYVVGNDDPDLAAILSTCTSFAARLIQSEMAHMPGIHKNVSDGSTCTCAFYRSLMLPCRHILLSRQEKG